MYTCGLLLLFNLCSFLCSLFLLWQNLSLNRNNVGYRCSHWISPVLVPRKYPFGSTHVCTRVNYKYILRVHTVYSRCFNKNFMCKYMYLVQWIFFPRDQIGFDQSTLTPLIFLLEHVLNLPIEAHHCAA